jgi:hypothetical protein
VNLTGRGTVALALALVALGGAVLAGTSGSTPSPSPSEPSTSPSAEPADPLRVPFSERFEPFDYREAPPLERTPIDGSFVRIVKLDELGGPVVGFPTHCRRCVPFEMDPGLETLTLFRGRYFLEHQLTGRRGLGHYEVTGDRVLFFNDPNCSGTTGLYRWRLGRNTLVLEGIRDPCPFGTSADSLDHRARDLTFSPWSKVRVCTAQIRSWWPALFACVPPESRSS